MLMLNKEELNALVGKTVYCYSLDTMKTGSGSRLEINPKIVLKQLKVMSVRDADPSIYRPYQSAWIGYYLDRYAYERDVRIDNIGNPSAFDSEWFSFERNDEQAKAVLMAYETERFAEEYGNLMAQISYLKAEHDSTIFSIQNSPIDDSMCKEEPENARDDVEL